MIEKTLATFAAEEEGARVVLSQVCEPGQTPTLELRMEQDCGEFGWTPIRRIRLAAGQIPDLRLALDMMDADAREARRPATERMKERGLRLIG